MATTFTTTVPEMTAAANHVADVAGSIASRLTDLESRLSPLLNSWKGEAAASFHNMREQWHQDAQQLHNALAEISAGLKATTANYDTTEESHKTGFSKIRATLATTR